MLGAALTIELTRGQDWGLTCCGAQDCSHTVIRHDDHVGFLKAGKVCDGCFSPRQLDTPLVRYLVVLAEHSRPAPALQLLCEAESGGPLVDHTFDFEIPCDLVVPLHNHDHSPDCGHDRVPHGDHEDYLV